MTFDEFLTRECGWREVRRLPDRGQWAGLSRLMFTTAIVVANDGDVTGTADRWCYHTEASAKAALDAWNGEGEPDGWHRHPMSGRRRGEDRPPWVPAEASEWIAP